MKSVHRTLGHRSLVILVSALSLAACSGKDTAADANADQTPMAASDTGAMSGMSGMQGMQAMGDGSMMQQMQTHMRMMDGAAADSIAFLLPTHRQMVANMIAQFNKDMRDMNMASDNAWNATVDSLRQDLTRMPEMQTSELQQLMSAHRIRVTRLMESHRKMMSDMKM
jgi:hypothetical protein